MLVILALLFSANCFITTATENVSNNAQPEVVSSESAVDSIENSSAESDGSTSMIAPIEPEISTGCLCTCNNNGTLTCGDNEILDNCPSYCPSDFCPTGDGQNKKCPQPKPCPPPACKCRFNSRRAINGTCIPTRDCPAFSCSDPNEVYTPCPPYCPTDDCSQATPTGKCPLPGRIGIILECRPTCRCRKGYWRKNGKCVPYDQCPGKLTCGPNEVVDDCPVDCESDYCPKSNKPQKSCKKPDQCPPPACKCAFNYRRADNGTCIPTRDCPPFKCDEPNQVYNSCPPLCPTDDCSQATPDGRCPLLGNILIVLECNPKCRCKNGYWKNNGTCVPYNECPGALKCPPGDVIDNCPLFCNTDYCPKNEDDIRTCAIPFVCPKPACKCPFNHLRAKNGTCIPASSCPPIKCTRPNEEFNSCPPACPSDDCRDASPSGECKLPGRIGNTVECRPGCRCKKSFWRQNGTCVPFGQCGLDCSGPHEYYACGGGCDNVCKTLHIQSQDDCPIRNIKCNDMCYCEKGYARDDKNICVPISQCPPPKLNCTGPNEYYDCSVECDNVCKDLDFQSKDNCPIVNIQCNDKCYCKPGFARDDRGICIPISQCPPRLNCTGPNEYYDCSVECDNVCKDLHFQSKDNCPIVNIQCNHKCYCKPGFARNDRGICIPISQCPPRLNCTGPNEYYDCSVECDNVCKDLHFQSKDNCPIVNVQCNPKCYCKSGFARDDKGICIPINQCPPKWDKRCRFPNEKYKECRKSCPSDRCSSVLERCIPCDTCSPGCDCLPGYLRPADGEPCIPQCQCSTLKNTSLCKNKNDKDKRCRFPNEKYTECKKKCPSDRCSSVIERCIPSDTCSPGCICLPGYLRPADGEPCIPQCQCSTLKNTSLCKNDTDKRCRFPNEKYTKCKKNCPSDRCSSVIESCIPSDTCSPGCVCLPGYLRTADGEPCIPQCQCSTLKNTSLCKNDTGSKRV